MKGALEDYLKEEEQEELLEAHDIICTLPNVFRAPYKIGSSLDVALRLNKFEKYGETFVENYMFFLFPFSIFSCYGTSMLEMGFGAPFLALGSAALGTYFASQFLGLEAVKNRRYNHKLSSFLFSGRGKRIMREVIDEHNAKLRNLIDKDMLSAKKEHMLEITDRLVSQDSSESFSVELSAVGDEWHKLFGKTDEEWVKAMSDEVYSFLGCNYDLPPVKRKKDSRRAYYVLSPDIFIELPATLFEFDISSTVAHELVHHCQRPYKKWLPRAVREGFADAVQNIAVESYAMKTGDNISEWLSAGYINDIFHSIKGIYLGDYSNLNSGINDSIVYKIGTAAFLAAEKMHGRGIYREILNAEKPAKLLVEMLGGRR